MNTAQLLEHLINCPSGTSAGTTAIIDIIEEYFKSIGTYSISTYSSNGVKNLVATLQKSSGKTFVFNCHIDTIDFNYTTARLAGTFVYGPGAINCKGPAVSHLLIAKSLLDEDFNGTVVFSFVGDEESFGNNGTKHLKDICVLSPDYLLVAAPTNNKVVNIERGVMMFTLMSYGIKAHAGNPALGINAIESLMIAICKIQSSGILTPSATSTSNLGIIGTNNTDTNSVPDFAFAKFDCRFDGIGPDLFFENISSFSKKYGCSVIRDVITSPFETPVSSVILNSLLKFVGNDPFIYSIGSSDSRHFPECINKIAFGPGNGNLGHSKNEYIDCLEIEKSSEICIKLVKDLLDV